MVFNNFRFFLIHDFLLLEKPNILSYPKYMIKMLLKKQIKTKDNKNSKQLISIENIILPCQNEQNN